MLASGDCHKGRVLKLEGAVLLLPEQQIDSSIDLWLYFTPDLPLELVLEDRSGKGHTGRSLDTDYEQRLRSWYESLPEWVCKPIEEAQRLEMEAEPLFDRKLLISAEDQDAHVHFFCEFLTPVLPPRELTEVASIARMVRMMSWSADDETFRGARRDVWQSPNFFMELRKGDFEDHAIYLCNLLLGLGKDAYVCVGRLHDSVRGEKRHVWVMVREVDGGVRMWETSTGGDVLLPHRWRPQAVQRKAAKGAGEKEKEEEAAVGDAEEDEAKKKRRKPFGFGRKKKVEDSSAAAAVASAAAQQPPQQAAAEAAQQAQLAAPGAEVGLVKAAEPQRKEKENEKAKAKAAPRRRRGGSQDDAMVVTEMELRELLNDDELLNRAAIEEAPPEIRYQQARPGGTAAIGTGTVAAMAWPSTTTTTSSSTSTTTTTSTSASCSTTTTTSSTSTAASSTGTSYTACWGVADT